MTEDTQDLMREQIARATIWAEAGKISLAVQGFALAREMAVALIAPEKLRQTILAERAGFVRERDLFRTMIEERGNESGKVLILGDSLGLPRPPNKTGPDLGAAKTYPWLLGDRLAGHRVTSLCQRFFTTQDAYDVLRAEPELGAGAKVVLHLGLNDCANRMFQENERLALSLYPEDIRTPIVNFAQKYRREILRLLPSRHYVTRDMFRTNLDAIAELLRQRNAQKIVLATIILPPAKFWPATPGVNANFGAYNQEIMNAALRHNALLLDIDRHVWQAINQNALLADGMHLSDFGHTIFADHTAKLLGA